MTYEDAERILCNQCIHNVHCMIHDEECEPMKRLKQPQWIPCSERLPEAEGEYLCSLYYAIPPYNLFHPENDIYIHTISIQRFDGTSFTRSVTAWMPLPPAYKEVSRDEL